MPRQPKFRPPKVSDPPALVEVEWVDALYDLDHDGPASSAGGLARLPSSGYHVRNGAGSYGPFVVLAREWSKSAEGDLNARHLISIPTGWIKRWAVVTRLDQMFPPPSSKPTEVLL